MNDYNGIINSIRALAEDQQPDTDISKLLYEHGCFYLLSKVSTRNEYTQRLQADLALNQICIKERYIACKPVFEMLERQNIPYAVIKGAVLSETAYKDMNVRKSGDIDLLIRRSDVDTVKKFMLQEGFIQGRVTDNGFVPFTRQELIFQTGLSHQTAPFIKKGNNPLCPYINVDINMDILWGESKQQSDMDFVMSQTEDMVVGDITTKKLQPIMEFVAMCLHHYKDMNSIYLLAEGSLKLGLFCDIYFHMKNNKISKEVLYDTCRRLKILEYIEYCLYYTKMIFENCNYMTDGGTFTECDLHLNDFGLTEVERQNWNISFHERLFNFNGQKFLDALTPDNILKINMNKMNM